MPRTMLPITPTKTSLLLMLLASVQAAPALSQEIIYGIEPGERVYRGERIYPGEPVYRPYRERVYREREFVPYEPGPLRHAPRPEVEILSPEAVTQRLYQRGFRRLGPVEIDRGYYELTAVDPAGNLIALSVSVVTGEVERSRVLQARAAPPTIFSAPENRSARASDPARERVTEASPPPSGSPPSGPPQSSPSQSSRPERAEAPASDEVARVDPQQPPPLPRPLPSRPMPVESVEESLTTASIPEAKDVQPEDDETATGAAAAPSPGSGPSGAASSSSVAKPDEAEAGVALSDFAEPEAKAPASGGKNGVRVIYPPTTATQVQPQGGDPSE